MMLTTDPFRETPIFLKRHRPLALGIELLLKNNEPLDITDCELRMVISEPLRKGGAVQVASTATLTEPLLGLARFDVQGDDVDFDPGSYELAITLVSPENFETTIVEGPVELTWNPDPALPVDYTTVSPPLGLTVKLLDQNRIVVKVTNVPGPQGVQGEQGIQGIQGLTGIKGDQGDQGIQGIQGAQGIQGVPGDPGMVIVNHGADPNVARPDAVVVYWIGTAYPVNATSWDIRSES